MSAVPATPRAAAAEEVPARAVALAREIPTSRRHGWWGMALVLVADISTFASLIAAYYYTRFVASKTFPPAGDPLPKLAKASIMTGLMVVSVAPMLLADIGLKKGSRPRLIVGAVLTALLGAGFVAVEYLEYLDELKTSTAQKDAYESLFYTLTGFHVLHIMLGVLVLLMFAFTAAIGHMGRRHHALVRIFSLFWYSSVVVWVILYGVLYWSVRI